MIYRRRRSNCVRSCEHEIKNNWSGIPQQNNSTTQARHGRRCHFLILKPVQSIDRSIDRSRRDINHHDGYPIPYPAKRGRLPRLSTNRSMQIRRVMQVPPPRQRGERGRSQANRPLRTSLSRTADGATVSILFEARDVQVRPVL